MFTSTGIFNITIAPQETGWAFLRCDDEIARYYLRSMGQYWLGINGCHITVVSKYDLFDTGRLKDIVGREFVFQYDSVVYTNGRAYWMDCVCEDFDKVRRDFGLNERKYHITLGNIKNALHQNRVEAGTK